jgi:hypothetical protein
MVKKSQAGLWVVDFDKHSPHVDWPTHNAMMDFVKRGPKLKGFIFGGDQNSNDEISHHNKSKILFRSPGSYARNTELFKTKILDPLEGALPKGAIKVWIEGNHDDWENQLVQENPELLGTVERRILLDLDRRGWHFVRTGHIFSLGKLKVIHGETLTGLGNQAAANHAIRAVLAYGSSVLYGHIHAPQSASRIAPFGQKDKHMGWCSPITGATNPNYLRNKPTAWVNGFTIVEVRDDGTFQVYPVVVTRGRFSFAGVEYGARKKSK